MKARLTACAALLLGVVPAARADELGRAGTAGLGLNGGLGYQHHGLGVQALYYQPLPLARMWLAPWVGAGSVPTESRNLFGAAAGVSGLYGRNLRALVDVGVGPVWTESLVLHGTPAAERTLRGVLFGGGVDYVAATGLVVRALGALAIPYDTGLTSRDPSWSLDFSVGYKLW